jgi:hypothetical protein
MASKKATQNPKKTSTKAELLAHIKALEQRAASTEELGTIAHPLTRKREPVEYTDQMVVALLELRFKAFRYAFNGSKSSKQLNLLWERLTLQFNIATGQAVNVTKAHRI